MPQKTNQIRTAFILFPGHPKQPHGFLVRCPEALGSKFKEFYFKGLNSWTKPLTHWLLVYKLIVLGNRGKKQGYFGWLTNCIAHQPIVLESCSNPQKTWQVFKSAVKKIFWFWVFLWVTS